MSLNFACIVLAAGDSTRYNINNFSTYNKTLLYINNKRLYEYSTDIFLSLNIKTYLVVRKEDMEIVKKETLGTGITIVGGGKSRTMSVKNALKLVKEDFVLIHDAARPLITSSLIKNILEIDYNFYNCAVVCKNISNSLFDKQKRTHLDRNNFLSLETPQVFKVTDIKTAYDNIDDNMVFYDDLSVLLNTFPNKSINYFIYNENNLKLTYESDFYLISNLLHGIDNTNYIYKIGYSYDFHKLVKNRKLILGGIEIPSEKGLLGHSDADCLLHAIAESFLGALSLGDLGKYYPDTNIAFLNKDSKEILKEIYNIIISNGFLINNIDCMVHLEKPKLGMYIDKQKLTIASILAIDPSLISIKATTNERVGLVGKEKGIACSVMTLLRKEVKNGN